MTTPVPGPGWRLLAPGTKLQKGDQYAAGPKWINTIEVGRPCRADLIYRRRAFPKSSTSSKINLGEKLAARDRAKALQMSTVAYIRQCVEGELNRSNIAKIQAQAPTATPPVSHWQNGESD
jgi:hypothetical protein